MDLLVIDISRIADFATIADLQTAITNAIAEPDPMHVRNCVISLSGNQREGIWLYGPGVADTDMKKAPATLPPLI